jgi:hypothetical protein
MTDSLEAFFIFFPKKNFKKWFTRDKIKDLVEQILNNITN